MNLTPLDVRKATFRKVIRGWDPEEVAAFLEVVAENYEQVLQDNVKLNERLQGLDDRLRQYQGMERLLQDSMLTAERLAADARDASRRESERRIDEARRRAERILADSRERLRSLNREIAELTQRKDLYLQKFRSLVESQILYLDERQQDLSEIEDIGKEVVDLLVEDAGNLEDETALKDGSETEDEAESAGAPDVADDDPFGEMEIAGSDSVRAPEPPDRKGSVHKPILSLEPGPSEAKSPAEVEPGADPDDDAAERPGLEVHPSRNGKGFFPPRVRREGFFDLEAEGGGDSEAR